MQNPHHFDIIYNCILIIMNLVLFFMFLGRVVAYYPQVPYCQLNCERRIDSY